MRDKFFSTILPTAITVIAVLMSVYHLYTINNPIFSSIQHLNVHLIFGTILVNLGLMAKYNKVSPFHILFIVFILVGGLYIHINFIDLVGRAGSPTTPDLIIGIILIATAIFVTKMHFGWPVPIVAALSILYAFFGQYLPGIFEHGGFSFGRIIGNLSTFLSGIYGVPLQASANIIVVFMIFMGFFAVMGGSELFNNLASGVAKYLRSGPAQVAVVSSGLMGMIQGTVAANVASTGMLTIPLMKDRGYSKEVSGAVESVASTGGQILPPVMGAAAFIMATIIGVPYISIVTAALIPALLYFLGVGVAVHLHACRLNLKPLKESEVQSLKDVLKKDGLLLVPLIVLIYMLVQRVSAPVAAITSIQSLIVVDIILSVVRKRSLKYVIEKEFWMKIVNGLRNGATGVAGIAVICAAMGIIIQVITVTGLSFSVAQAIVQASAGIMILGLFLTMFASIMFGLGVPTVAAYILVSTLTAPALLQFDVPLIASHLFVFYFAIIASLSPPVAIGPLIASGISGGDFVKTAITACRLAIPGFLIPYMFVYRPELLMDGPWYLVLHSSVSIGIALIALAMFFERYLYTNNKMYETVAALVLALAIIFIPSLVSDAIGAGGLILILIMQRRRVKIKEADNYAPEAS